VLVQASAGDAEAFDMLLSIQGLLRPLDALLTPPWPERLAAAQE
jgi:hypothetical protein